jgi:hypothetical protein
MKMPELKIEVFNFVAAVCLVAITVLLFIIMVLFWRANISDAFSDTSATAIMCKQVMEGRPSLCDKVDAANVAATKSNLTGSRDIPVFFQDFDYEMERKGTTFKSDREGYVSRENFEDKLSNNAIENVKPADLMDALKGY